MSQPPRPPDDSFPRDPSQPPEPNASGFGEQPASNANAGPYGGQGAPPSFSANSAGQPQPGGQASSGGAGYGGSGPAGPGYGGSGPGGPGGSGGGGWSPVPPEPPKKRKGLIAAIIAGIGCLVALIVIVIIIVAVFAMNGGKKDPDPSPTPSSSAPAPSTTEPSDPQTTEPQTTEPQTTEPQSTEPSPSASDSNMLYARAVNQGPPTGTVQSSNGEKRETQKGEFLPVTIEMRNSSSRSVNLKDADFTLTDSKGQTYEWTYVRAKNGGQSTLKPGESVTLEVYFDVPKDSRASRVAIKVPSFSSGTLTISVP